MIQAALIVLIAFLTYMGGTLGYSRYDRPLCTGILVDTALSNVQQGLMMGASLELAYVGTLTISGAFPPDIYIGGILGAAFAITTGSGIEGAAALFPPVATFTLLMKQIIYTSVRGLFVHRANGYALQGNDSKVTAMHVWSTLVYYVPMAIVVGVCFYVGGPAVQTVLDQIPTFITEGLSATDGILPALGFVVLVKMIISKELAPCFSIGFLITSYLQIPIFRITCIAILVTLLAIMNDRKKNNVEMEGMDDNEF